MTSTVPVHKPAVLGATMPVTRRSYYLTYLGYGGGFVAAITLTFAPLMLLALASHVGLLPNMDNWVPGVHLVIGLDLLTIALAVLGFVALPPLGVYLVLRCKREPRATQTALYCLALVPTLIFGIPMFFVPLAARYLSRPRSSR